MVNVVCWGPLILWGLFYLGGETLQTEKTGGSPVHFKSDGLTGNWVLKTF